LESLPFFCCHSLSARTFYPPPSIIRPGLRKGHDCFNEAEKNTFILSCLRLGHYLLSFGFYTFEKQLVLARGLIHILEKTRVFAFDSEAAELLEEDNIAAAYDQAFVTDTLPRRRSSKWLVSPARVARALCAT
jgi:hypothetical protein